MSIRRRLVRIYMISWRKMTRAVDQATAGIDAGEDLPKVRYMSIELKPCIE